MKRKLIQFGKNSLILSLPAEWLRKNLLKKGDELEVTEDTGALTLSTKKQAKTNEITIELDTKKGLYKRLLKIPYARGYDRIIIKYHGHEAAEFVEKNIIMLTGFEIVQKEAGTIILEEIAHTDENFFSTIFERLINVIISMLLEFKKAFETGDFRELYDVAGFEDQVNKLSLYCRRILNIYGHSSKEIERAVYSIIQNLECMGDTLGDALIEAPKKELTKNLETALLADMIIDIMKLNHKILFKHDFSLAAQVAQKERVYLQAITKAEKGIINRYLFAIYYPMHHISEEVLYTKNQ